MSSSSHCSPGQPFANRWLLNIHRLEQKAKTEGCRELLPTICGTALCMCVCACVVAIIIYFLPLLPVPRFFHRLLLSLDRSVIEGIEPRNMNHPMKCTLQISPRSILGRFGHWFIRPSQHRWSGEPVLFAPFLLR